MYKNFELFFIITCLIKLSLLLFNCLKEKLYMKKTERSSVAMEIYFD
jgi:hypothetical protein